LGWSSKFLTGHLFKNIVLVPAIACGWCLDLVNKKRRRAPDGTRRLLVLSWPLFCDDFQLMIFSNCPVLLRQLLFSTKKIILI
jgi:hypothetical protein